MINSRVRIIALRSQKFLRNRSLSSGCTRPATQLIFEQRLQSAHHNGPTSQYQRNIRIAPSFSCQHIQKRQFSGDADGAVVTETLESLGDSITTAVLLSWNKEPGDSVAEDDVIAVVETDKVTMDIRAKRSGVFTEALVKAEAEVEVGAPLYKLDTSITEAPLNSEATHGNAPPPAADEGKLPPITVDVPVMGESVTTGMLASWMVKTGDRVRADDVVAVIETDKVNVDVRSPESGLIVERYAEEGDDIEVGHKLFVLDPTPAPAGDEEAAAPPRKEDPPRKSEAAPVPAPEPPAAAPAPPQKKAAPEPAPAPPQKAAAPPASGGGGSSSSKSSSSSDRSETRVKMTRMRQRIAHRLKEAQNTAAMLTTFQEVDMTNLIAMRNKYKELFEKEHDVKLGFMSAFVRASTAALLEIPAVNAVIDDETNEIVYRNYVDISVAVASPNGLVVPVLRNTEKMNFADVEKTIGMYGKKAKDGALALEDMAGGTFTISNGGVFGSLFGTPIINPPQSAILGMHATKMRPVVMPGTNTIEARPMMYLALTYDHRMIDGREAVTFLKSVQAKIEDPSRLLLQL